jgi:hypothetical protein
MVKRFFTQEQYDALNEALVDFDFMILERGRSSRFDSQKSNLTIVEDLYRAILKNYDLPQDKFEASSAGWLVKVEKPFRVTVEWSPRNPENYGWTMNYVKK